MQVKDYRWHSNAQGWARYVREGREDDHIGTT
jgi:hypothetical protein